VGDPVVTHSPRSAEVVTRPPPGAVYASRQLFMCGGCYFIYDQSVGLPDQSIAPGTPFTAIPSNWRCPDCGTDKTTFRPHVEPPQRKVIG
jgi:GntR family transcriptional regulator / MocR family aminotransferase